MGFGPVTEESATVFRLSVGSRSDIWVGESDIATTNRSRLGNVFQKIMTSFTIDETRLVIDELAVGPTQQKALADLIDADHATE